MKEQMNTAGSVMQQLFVVGFTLGLFGFLAAGCWMIVRLVLGVLS
jgi:uncharacterized membrane protein